MDSLHWLPCLADADAALRAAGALADPNERVEALLTLSRHRLDFLQVSKLDRLLERALQCGGDARLPRTKVGWLASSTVAHLVPATRVAALSRGLLVESYVCPYGLHRQDVLDPSSGLAGFAPDAVVFSIDRSELVPALPLEAKAAEVDAAIAARVEATRDLWREAMRRFQCAVVQETVPDVAAPVFGSFDALVPASPSALIQATNHALKRAAREDGVLILDLEACSSRLGKDTWFDPVRWHHGKQLVSPRVSALYGHALSGIIAAARGLAKKALVLDLDNTLWGGVVGDDGMENLALGPGSARGEAFVEFQRYVRSLAARGVVLAVCSKNELATAEHAFSHHPEMILERDDIAVFVANWTDKATNLEAIATSLNLGLDALVFFDDNPAERAIVRQKLPMVAVPEVPEEPALYARCLGEAGYFEASAFTREDGERARQYHANARRGEVQKAHGGDLEAFLRSLEMEMTKRRFEEEDLVRVAQLINKTNQFNLTTRRYTEADVRALGRDPAVIGLHFRLKDIFGDNGIISVVIARPDPEAADTLVIDTWLMSCRVLGRGVELAALNALAEEAARRGARALRGDYIPTAKNDLVREHYEKIGFVRAGEGQMGPGSTRWSLSLRDYTPKRVPIVTAGA